MADIYIDVAELLRNPIRTGIQRVVRELLSHWPSDRPARLVRYDPATDQLLTVEDDVIEWVLQSGHNPYLREDAFRTRLQQVLGEAGATVAAPKAGDWLLAPELFVSLQRGGFYENIQKRGVRIAMIVFDFIAWISPDQVSIEKTGGLNHYLEVLKKADRRCFISSAVRDHYYERMLRAPIAGDAVIPLGADGLKGQPIDVEVDSAPFVAPGALDGRKGQDLVFDAFLETPACRGRSIIFAGRVPEHPRANMVPLIGSEAPGVTVINDPDDGALSQIIQNAVACFFISRHEGFGLPALESLHLGVPVVVSADLPSVADIPDHGQIRLKTVDADSLATAFARLAQPAEAARLRAATRKLTLRTWKDYAASVSTWLAD